MGTNVAATRPAAASALPPAAPIFKEFARDLLSLPGSIYTGWAINAPNEVHLVFESKGDEDLARAVLNPRIDGIDIALTTYVPKAGGNGGVAGAKAGARLATPEGHLNASNMVRAVSAMPGVWEHSTGGMTIRFATVTDAQAAHLKRLVRDTFGGYTIEFAVTKPT